MAEFEKKKHAQDEFNNGNKYVANDGVQPATINNLVENSLYTEALAESLASTPDTTNVAQTGTPSVELVDNPSAGITGAKKFKFSNLKGDQGPGYLRANVSLDTTATSVPSSNISWGPLTEALVSDSIVDNNGNVFAVTARTAATSPTIPISYRTSIRGTAGADGTDGEDGASVFIRYSASSNGANMTATPAANTRYIGFYRGQSASNTASDYTWSQYVGKEISEVTIDEFSFVITYDDGTTSTAPLNTENCLVTYAVPSGEATAMTAYLVPSNANLNDYRGENYWGKTFYAGGSNTVRNAPVAGIAFNLEVLRSGALETAQRITMMATGSNNQPTVYTRSVADSTATSADGTWTQWQEIAETNGTYPDMTVGNSTNATNDGGGNNIASTYATQSALSSGLAGKANTSGAYPNLTVGNATNAANATSANTANALSESGRLTKLWNGEHVFTQAGGLAVPNISEYGAILANVKFFARNDWVYMTRGLSQISKDGGYIATAAFSWTGISNKMPGYIAMLIDEDDIDKISEMIAGFIYGEVFASQADSVTLKEIWGVEAAKVPEVAAITPIE